MKQKNYLKYMEENFGVIVCPNCWTYMEIQDDLPLSTEYVCPACGTKKYIEK